ncbi:MAG: helix-turn-helix domain-containing protein [Azonexus sp.]|nr:helix-turn-helix domain-containing protein [Azonexus sp.]
MNPNPELITNAEAAALIGIRPNTLEGYRTRGISPPFVKLNPESSRSPIRYDRQVVLDWLAARTMQSTSQYPQHQTS